MNAIQKISQDILIRRLKLQMGLDPAMKIDPQRVQEMWRALQNENNLAAAARLTQVQVHH